MKITYDPEVDALYIRFLDTTVTTKHVDEGISLDYSADGRLAGIEILDARKRFSLEVFQRVTLEGLPIVSLAAKQL
jgi:uncharacterized protein YuzE